MTETSDKLTDENRLSLFRSWAKFWDLRKPFLLEKSPPNILRMRFLQATFTSSRSFFLMALRHPLGTFRNVFANLSQNNKSRKLNTCGQHFVDHWLKLYETAEKDIKNIRNIKIFQLEYFIEHSTGQAQEIVEEMERYLGLQHDVHVRANRNITLSNGRKLQEFHGNRNQIVIELGTSMNWISDWQRALSMRSASCQEVIKKYENRVNRFGYSLKNATSISKPTAFEGHLLLY